MYAIFLLVLLADVARAHASVPAGGDAGSILRAASQLQVSESGDAILVFRRTDGASAQVAQFNCSNLRFSGWSKSLAGQSSSSRQSRLAPSSKAALAAMRSLGSGIDGGLLADLSFLPGTPALAVFVHTGSPAP